MSADDRRPPGGDEVDDWEVLQSSADLDQGTASALKDLERIAAFSRDLQRTGTMPDGAPHESSPAPERWGHLMLLERVGAGAQGEVWRAWDATLQRQVALKFLQTEGIGRTATSRLVAEARALARVRHPNVVGVYGVAEHDGRAGMWMEWIEGLTLAREIERRGGLPPREVARIGLDLCSALEALEAAGLVHRDVKPANIVLETGGRVALTDFGLGWRPALEGVKGSSSGTPLFMAPELLRGGEPSPRTDLYALGVTLWWALAGRPPFTSRKMEEILEEAARGPAQPLREARKGTPEALVNAIEWGMKPQESERPPSAAQLRERLGRAFPGSVEGGGTGTRLSRLLAAPGAWWKLVIPVVAVAGLAWWIVASTGMHDDGPAAHWTARQIPMPPEMWDIPDYSLSADGSRIAYVSDSRTALSVFSIETSDTRVVDRLAPGEGSYTSVSWASDGSKLAVARCDAAGEATEVLVDPITGRRQVWVRLGKIGATELLDAQPALSPDGRFVAVRSDYRPATSRFHALNLVDVATGAVRALARSGRDQFIGPPAWAPGGARLAYVLERGNGEYSRIETCDLRGSRTQVVEDSTGALSPYGYDYRTLLWLGDDRLLYALDQPGSLSDWWTVRIDAAGRPRGKPRQAYGLAGAAVVGPTQSHEGSVAFTALRRPRRLTFLGTDGMTRYPALERGVLLAGLREPIWSWDGGSLFVRSEENPTHVAIGRVALSTGRFEAIVPIRQHRDRPLCPTPDARDLLCSIDSQLVAVPLGGGAPRLLAKSFHGAVLYARRADRWAAVDHVGHDIIVRDFNPGTGLGAIRFRIPAAELDETESPTADLSPDGMRLVILRGDNTGYDVLDAESGRAEGRIPMPANSYPQSIRWAPDGTTLYATAQDGPATYWIARLGMKGVDRVIWKSEDTWPGELGLSPDGTTLAFTAMRMTSELWIMKPQ
jgi:serine/threonine protein kinase/Tol biopolymer transport system component